MYTQYIFVFTYILSLVLPVCDFPEFGGGGCGGGGSLNKYF